MAMKTTGNARQAIAISWGATVDSVYTVSTVSVENDCIDFLHARYHYGE